MLCATLLAVDARGVGGAGGDAPCAPYGVEAVEGCDLFAGGAGGDALCATVYSRCCGG